MINQRQPFCPVPPNAQAELKLLKEMAAAAQALKARILVADDQKAQRQLLTDCLEELGHEVITAKNGDEALSLLRSEKVDLILLDIVMPGKSGYSVLQFLKQDPSLRAIPVIITSGEDDRESITTCIQAGADDYLLKPVNLHFLKARVAASLEKTRIREIEEASRILASRLLANTFPKVIAERLMKGEEVVAEYSPEVTVLFADIVGFTRLSARMHPVNLVNLLNSIFRAFDQIADDHGVEKIKTIGDSYMAVRGLPSQKPDDAEAVAEMALGMIKAISNFQDEEGTPLEIRVGINTGPVVSGILGEKKLSYDLWGDTVNVASRMESDGIPGKIQVGPATHEKLKNKYAFEKREEIEIKGKGRMAVYLLKAKL